MKKYLVGLTSFFHFKSIKKSDYVIFVILNGFFCLSLVSFIIVFVFKFLVFKNDYQGAPIFNILIFALLIFIALILFNKGYVKEVSYFLLVLILSIIFLIIQSSGIENFFAFFFVILYIIFIAIIFRGWEFLINLLIIFGFYVMLGYAQIEHILKPNLAWRTIPLNWGDILGIIAVLSVIALISWLFNYEINRYVAELEKSEKLLQKERDMLQETVKKRTKRLQTEQAVKLAQQAKFAEFGLLAQGLFHDLINPLTALSLNLNQIKKKGDFSNLVEYVDGSLAAAENMQKLISSTESYFDDNFKSKTFSILAELANTQQLFALKAKKAGVMLNFQNHSDIKLIGNSTKFAQLVDNLVLNAIEAYLQQKKTEAGNRDIIINFSRKTDWVEIKVIDKAGGIPEKVRKNVFKPFFTTKKKLGHSGLGLSICKNIVEGDFLGRMTVVNKVGRGAEFTIFIPKIMQGKE